MRILHARELEVLVPVGPLFEKRRRAVTDLHPAGSLIREGPRILHVPQMLAFGYRALTEIFLPDGLEQVGLAAWLNTASHQVAPGYSSPASASIAWNWLLVRMSIDCATSLLS